MAGGAGAPGGAAPGAMGGHGGGGRTRTFTKPARKLMKGEKGRASVEIQSGIRRPKR